MVNDLIFTSNYFLQGWFNDMSRLFLSCPVPKLLLVAGMMGMFVAKNIRFLLHFTLFTVALTVTVIRKLWFV
jgi:hypothetical protein